MAGRFLAAGLLLISGLYGLVGCQSQPVETPSESAVTYVGRETCATCHQTEVQDWTGSHHDQAMQEATETTVLGDFEDATLDHFGETFAFFKQDSTFFVRTNGPDGTPQTYPIAYTFGVTPLQQYLIGFPNGRYQALAAAWDARSAEEGGQRWFHMYPDEAIPPGDLLHWTGTYQNWNYMCADCHSTNLQKGYDVASDQYNTTWSEIDVSCEACHGPASEHVTWAQTGSEGSDNKGFLVALKDANQGAWRINTTTGNAERTAPLAAPTQVETCARCHARRSVLAEPWQPQQAFLTTHRPALLDEGLYHADGQILDEVYVYGSFVQSKMHAKGVVCSDCHNPHSLELKAPGNALCGSCHLSSQYDTPDHHFHEAGTAGAQCVECHMPTQTYMVVDPRRDHSLRVPRPDLSVKLRTPNACTQCHTTQSDTWAANTIARWYGPNRRQETHYGEAIAAGQSGVATALPQLTALAADGTQPAIARATAASLVGRYPSAEAVASLQNTLADTEPLVRMASLSALEPFSPADRVALASRLLSDSVEAVRLEAARVLAAVPRAQIPPDLQVAFTEALQAYETAQLVNADRPESHMNLGLLYAQQGRLGEAQQAYRTALRIAPWFVQAYVNLADVYRALGRDAEGEGLLRKAIQRDATAAEAHYSLGLLLVRQRKTDEALTALHEAVRLQPANARFSYVLGVALNTNGQAEQALQVLERAYQQHPNDGDILTALATMNRDAGNREVALRYARALLALNPQNPSAQQLVAQLEAAGS